MRNKLVALLTIAAFTACNTTQGTDPPPDGWANNAPTQVTQVVTQGDSQLLEVQQGELRAWVDVPKVGAQVGDYVLLGQGTPRNDVTVEALGRVLPQVVDIQHIQVVDEATARSTVRASAPDDAVPIGTVYAALDARDGQPIVVYGTVVKATSAVGSVWVHLQDGTGDAASNTHDITVQASEPVTVGQRVAYRGRLKANADIGFGYTFDVLVEEAEVVR